MPQNDSASNSLRWGATDNPGPRSGSHKTWTTIGGNGAPIRWLPDSPQSPVAFATRMAVPDSASVSGAARIQATGLGFCEITAVQPANGGIPGKTLTRTLLVGELCAYKEGSDPPSLFGGPTDIWSMVDSRPAGFPAPPTPLDHKDWGLAFKPDTRSVLLNLPYLFDLVTGQEGDVAYFQATLKPTGDERIHAPLQSYDLYAYGTDGLLWHLNWHDWRQMLVTPSPFPTKAVMDQNQSTLAWGPPAGFGNLPPTTPSVAAVPGDAVTCFVLNPGQFSERNANDSSYYSFHVIEDPIVP